MPDKGCRLSDLGSSFLHLNSGNDVMPINPHTKCLYNMHKIHIQHEFYSPQKI